MYRDFNALLQARQGDLQPTRRAIVAGAVDEHALQAVFDTSLRERVRPVLVGDQKAVVGLLDQLGFAGLLHEIVHCPTGENPAQTAVRLVREHQGDFIIKGRLETRDLLKPILNRETGLNQRGFITHFGLMQLQGYPRLLAMSDSAVIPHPTLEEKVQIIKACVEALCRLGYARPVVGALCAVETVNEKMPETLDARVLQDLSDAGAFSPGIVAGPISFDLATQKESARIKGYNSPYAGEVDLLLVPDLVTGNVMSKIWNVMPDNILAGCLIGADVPVVLTSRSAGMTEKLYSILLCSLLS